MNELDEVKLTQVFNNLPIGTHGVIVLKYNNTYYEIEFFDSLGNTIGVLTTPCHVLNLVSSS